MNYFEFFEIPISFYPDKSSLRVKYLSNSKKFHPDVFQGEDEDESLELTAINNKAFTTLNSETKLVHYVLHELFPSDEKLALPPMFLMEMMEKNEELMDAKMEGDEDGLKRIREEVLDAKKSLEREMESVKQSFSLENMDSLDALRVLDLKNNYLKRIITNLENN